MHNIVCVLLSKLLDYKSSHLISKVDGDDDNKGNVAMLVPDWVALLRNLEFRES